MCLFISWWSLSINCIFALQFYPIACKWPSSSMENVIKQDVFACLIVFTFEIGATEEIFKNRNLAFDQLKKF